MLPLEVYIARLLKNPHKKQKTKKHWFHDSAVIMDKLKNFRQLHMGSTALADTSFKHQTTSSITNYVPAKPYIPSASQ